jgi:hypothetical protein
MATRAADQSPATPDDGRPPPRVLVHIGEPKTGTTFLQQVMWSNRAELAAQGVVLPGHHPQDHFSASQDLRVIEKRPDDPAGSLTGEGDPAHQAAGAPRGRGHLPRTLLRRGRTAGAAGGPFALSSHRGPRRADRAGHGVAAPAGVAGDGQTPNDHGWEDWLCGM